MIVFFVVSALAHGLAEFEAANKALAAGDLALAEHHYREALAVGGVDADVYYDLGNVLYRQQKLGLSILAWRRSLSLSPRDPDAAANLDFARRTRQDDVSAADPYPVWAPWQAALTGDEGQWIGAALAAAGLLAVALRSRATHLPLAGMGGIAVGFGVLVGAGGVMHGRLPASAVVLVDEVNAQSDLGGGVDLFSLHLGAEVQVVESSSGRVLVSLGDGRRAWIPEAAVGRVDPWALMP